MGQGSSNTCGFVWFQTGPPQVTQVGPEAMAGLKLALNSWCCLSTPSAGITGLEYCAQLSSLLLGLLEGARAQGRRLQSEKRGPFPFQKAL